MTDARAERGGRAVWQTGGLLAAVIVHNLIYPISQTGLGGAIFFYAFYAAMFVVGTWLLSRSGMLRALALVAGVAAFAAGVAHATLATSVTEMAVFVTSIAHHLVIMVVLAIYIFAARQVFTEIILAATSLYLVLGSAFAAVFALIEWLQPGSFLSANGSVADWQDLLYFSYVTLTSLGYGDILPVKYYAQAFAALEAIVGVLYTVILLSRLVGMHTART